MWKADGHGFESHPRQPIFSLKNDCFSCVHLFDWLFMYHWHTLFRRFKSAPASTSSLTPVKPLPRAIISAESPSCMYIMYCALTHWTCCKGGSVQGTYMYTVQELWNTIFITKSTANITSVWMSHSKCGLTIIWFCDLVKGLHIWGEVSKQVLYGYVRAIC